MTHLDHQTWAAVMAHPDTELGPPASSDAIAAFESSHGIALPASHRDQVLRLPAGATWLFEGARCRYAGFTLGDHVVTCQGHPEFTAAYLRGLLDHRRAHLGEALWRRARESLASALDQILMGRWLLCFLHGREMAES